MPIEGHWVASMSRETHLLASWLAAGLLAALPSWHRYLHPFEVMWSPHHICMHSISCALGLLRKTDVMEVPSAQKLQKASKAEGSHSSGDPFNMLRHLNKHLSNSWWTGGFGSLDNSTYNTTDTECVCLCILSSCITPNPQVVERD